MHTSTALAPRLAASAARGAGRRSALADGLAEMDEALMLRPGAIASDVDPFTTYDAWLAEEARIAERDAWLASSPCGGTCRRCLLHDDPGGCIG